MKKMGMSQAKSDHYRAVERIRPASFFFIMTFGIKLNTIAGLGFLRIPKLWPVD